MIDDSLLAAMTVAVSATVPMAVSDPLRSDNPLIYANEAFYTLCGYEADEVLGRNCRFLQGKGTDPATVDKLRAGIENAEPTSVEMLNYRKDGTPFWNALYVAPILDPSSGTPRFFFAMQLDVTRRYEAEAALQKAPLRRLRAWMRSHGLCLGTSSQQSSINQGN